MSIDFSFPEDLYFWGQNRLGSLVSLLAYPLVKILSIHPVVAVSIVKYTVLIAGYFSFSFFFKSSLVRVLLALVWFLPPFHQAAFVLYLFGVQLSLTGIGINFLSKFIDALKNKDFLMVHLFIGLSCLSLGASLWVSDPTIITLFLLVLMGFFGTSSFLSRNGPVSIGKFASIIVHFVFWIGLTFGFVYFAKENATDVPSYSSKILNNFKDFTEAFSIFFHSVLDIALFRSESLVEPFYLYGVILIVAGGVFNRKKIKFLHVLLYNKWALFFGVNFLLFFGMTFFSHWVLDNGVARRYFTIAYAFGWITALFFIDSYYQKKTNQILKFVLPVVLVGSLSGFIGFYFPKRIPPKIEIVSGFNSLGQIGLIGEYWNSYISACPNPFAIKATPCDTVTVRSKKMAQEALSQPKLFLIKDMWLDSFPSMIFQFDTGLYRVGEPMKIGGAEICEYKVDVCRKFNYLDTELRSSCRDPIIDNESVSGKVFRTDSNAFKSHFMFGPYVSLTPGSYALKIRLKIDSKKEDRVICFADVAAKGNDILGARNIGTSDFSLANKYQDIILNFSINKEVSGTEFRILYFGGPTLFCDFMRLYKL